MSAIKLLVYYENRLTIIKKHVNSIDVLVSDLRTRQVSLPQKKNDKRVKPLYRLNFSAFTMVFITKKDRCICNGQISV